MGVKYQVVCSSYPAELVDVTLNHLDSMRVMVEGDDSLDALVVSFRDQFKKVVSLSPPLPSPPLPSPPLPSPPILLTLASQRYENLSFGDFLSLKQTLHAFFQDRRVKVSLFLQEGLQTQTGTMVFPHCEHLPPGVVTPNTVKYDRGRGREGGGERSGGVPESKSSASITKFQP